MRVNGQYNIGMIDIFSRTKMLLGADAMKKLAASRVAVFGIGGVGGHAMEALVRSGVGAIDLIDHDTVDETNLNRQIIATQEVIGRLKVEVAAERIASINPQCKVRIHDLFYLPDVGAENREDSDDRSVAKDEVTGSGNEQSTTGSGNIDLSDYDYVIDAIDTVAGKLGLIEAARAAGTPIICSMGAGNKLDASAFKVADIYETTVCPLAKVIRRECRRRGIESLKVVYSDEEPVRPHALETSKVETAAPRKVPPGSVAFAPAVAGLIMAGEVVRDLCGE